MSPTAERRLERAEEIVAELERQYRAARKGKRQLLLARLHDARTVALRAAGKACAR